MAKNVSCSVNSNYINQHNCSFKQQSKFVKIYNAYFDVSKSVQNNVSLYVYVNWIKAVQNRRPNKYVTIFNTTFDICEFYQRKGFFNSHIMKPFIPLIYNYTNTHTGCPYDPVLLIHIFLQSMLYFLNVKF